MKTLDKYVISAALYIIIWSLAFYISWLVIREEPGILEGCILAPGVVEMVCAAWIKRGKNKKETSNDDITDDRDGSEVDGGNCG